MLIPRQEAPVLLIRWVSLFYISSFREVGFLPLPAPVGRIRDLLAICQIVDRSLRHRILLCSRDCHSYPISYVCIYISLSCRTKDAHHCVVVTRDSPQPLEFCLNIMDGILKE